MGIKKTIKDNFKSETFTKFSSLSKKDRNFAIAFVAGVFLIGTIIFSLVFGKLCRILMGRGSIFYWGLIFKPGLVFSLIAGALCAYTAFVFFIRRPLTNKEDETDERGVTFMKNGVHGTGRWMSEEEADEVYDITSLRNTKEIVYGQKKGTKGGKQAIAYKDSATGASKNKNTIILGSPGSGKSFTFVRNNIMQAIRQEISFVVTDPKGELYTSIAELARKHGYDVRVLNTANPEYSDHWNCLEETINKETERLDSTRLNEFTKIFMKNSSEGKEEQFWFDSAQNLLNVGICYVSWIREKYILDEYNKLMRKVSGMSFDPLYTMRPFPWYRQKILEAAKENGYDLDAVNEVFKEIMDNAPEYNLGKVHETLQKFKEIEGQYENLKMPSNHPGIYSYAIYRDIDGQTAKSSALTGIRLKLGILGDEKLKKMLSKNDIDVREINKKKTAVFVIMTSGANAPAKPITSLFFSFFFKDEIEDYNKYNNIENATGKKNPCRPVLVMLDEFSSIGVIGGDPVAFSDTMAIVRSSKLYVQIIIQTISQLISMYGEDIKDTITSCCATCLCLGVNDQTTAEFVSFYTGTATVLSERHKERSTAINTDAYTSDIQFTTVKREVMSPDEVMRLKNVLIVRQGEQALLCDPLPYLDNPLYPEIENKSIESTIPPINIYEEKVNAESSELKIHKMIESLTKINYGAEVIEDVDLFIPEVSSDDIQLLDPSSPLDIFESEPEIAEEVKEEKPVISKEPVKAIIEEKPTVQRKTETKVVEENLISETPKIEKSDEQKVVRKKKKKNKQKSFEKKGVSSSTLLDDDD